ncbi:MAG: hypothetical protein KA773_22625, partial [Chloroflexi bacterium]|nr:hypothetical protein [Chloroflexota bacterium]
GFAPDQHGLFLIPFHNNCFHFARSCQQKWNSRAIPPTIGYTNWVVILKKYQGYLQKYSTQQTKKETFTHVAT